ncbi:hypothetical protein FOPE_10762 [Fonsecaea pedrosoi]|nr:hypothetical protein FOPE_10762 [Fonsecaea pedrosoi]
MPAVQVFEEVHVVTISIVSGTLIRPVRMLVNNCNIVGAGPFVDSMCVYRTDTTWFINKLFPDPTIEPEQFVHTIARYIDYNKYTMEPRANPAAQMLLQSMNKFPIKGDATMVSLGESEPLVKSDVLDAIMYAQTPEARVLFPDKNIATAFVNRSLNTEDAISGAVVEPGMGVRRALVEARGSGSGREDLHEQERRLERKGAHLR